MWRFERYSLNRLSEINFDALRIEYLLKNYF